MSALIQGKPSPLSNSHRVDGGPNVGGGGVAQNFPIIKIETWIVSVDFFEWGDLGKKI